MIEVRNYMNVHCINVNKSLDENLFCLMSYSSCFLENQGFVVCWHINLQHGIKFVNNLQYLNTYMNSMKGMIIVLVNHYNILLTVFSRDMLF